MQKVVSKDATIVPCMQDFLLSLRDWPASVSQVVAFVYVTIPNSQLAPNRKRALDERHEEALFDT